MLDPELSVWKCSFAISCIQPATQQLLDTQLKCTRAHAGFTREDGCIGIDDLHAQGTLLRTIIDVTGTRRINTVK